MENKLRSIAAEFLSRPEARCFIGYETAPGGQVRAAFIRRPEDASRLVWNRRCLDNLASYLADFRGPEGIVGIAVKGCDARALRELIRSRQVDRANLYIVGLPCTDSGLQALDGEGIADRCLGCVFPENFSYDAQLGPMETPNLPPRPGETILDGLDDEQRLESWKKELGKCIGCDACRKTCYACFCPQCIFESQHPRWLSGRRTLADKFFFHSVRAFHLAGRCIRCGECQRACPAGVQLMLLNHRLADDSEALFNGKGIGVSEDPPPLITFSKDDPEPFPGGHE
jgi:ferredoxin